MWEQKLQGDVGPAFAQAVPKGVSVDLLLLRQTARGRHASVFLAGVARDRRRALRRLLGGMETVRQHISLSPNVEIIGGFLPSWGPKEPGATSAKVEDPKGPDFLGALAAFELQAMGKAGVLASARIEGGQLTLCGYPEVRPASPPPSEGILALDKLGLFEPGTMRSSARSLSVVADDDMQGLRAREREVAGVAFSLGYYEKPRRCTMDDIARTLGVSRSAVCIHLQAFEQKAIRRFLQELGDPTGLVAPPPTAAPSASLPLSRVPAMSH